MEALTWAAMGTALIGCAFLALAYIRDWPYGRLMGIAFWLVASAGYIVYDVAEKRPWALTVDVLLAGFWAYTVFRLLRERKAATS